MSVLETELDLLSPGFLEDREHALSLLKEFREQEARVRRNSESKRPKFERQKKLMPRERLNALLDAGAPFLALSTLAGFEMHDDDGAENASGGGMIAGIGFVSGRRVCVAVTDSAIKGGAVSPMGLKKTLRLQEIALLQKLPLVVLAESAGANLNYQSEMFIEGGRSFANQARLSAAGIPQITVVHGSSTAGGAYLPGLSDYVILIRDQSKIYLAGPPLLKAATGEVATDEELGGSALHAQTTGLGEYVAEDDAHAISIARLVVRHAAPVTERGAASDEEPRVAADTLCGVIPKNPKQPFDTKEVIARVFDGSEFLEFKGAFGPSTLCGHAQLRGVSVGVIANNGPIDPQGAQKAAHFIQLCDAAKKPLIFLMNTTGFLVGTDPERGGIVKHGSKMIQAVANARVPKLTVVLGGSWGAGNYGMCGRGLSPDFIFSWPSARVGVMGPEQAGSVLQIIAEQKFARMQVPIDVASMEAIKSDVVKKMEPETQAVFGSARLWDDGIIDPRDTRKVLSFCLQTCLEASLKSPQKNTFGVARF